MAPDPMKARLRRAGQPSRQQTMRRVVWGAVFSVGLIACPTTPAPPESGDAFSACADLACREAWIVQHWAEAPERAATALASLDDPLEQIVLIRAVAKTGVGDLAVVCQQMKRPTVVTECTRLQSRPHLHATAPASSRGRDFGGLQLPDGALDPFADTPAQMAPECADEAPAAQRTCQQRSALGQAREGQAAAAAGACAAIVDETWKAECLFRAAEVLLLLADVRTTRMAARMCLSSVNFAGQCMSHISRDLSAIAPAPVAANAAVWSVLQQRIDAVSAAAAIGGEAYQRGITNRIWAQVLTVGFMRSERIDGSVLSALRGPARPHARAALALRMVAEPGAEATDLDTLRHRLVTAFEQSDHRTFTAPPQKSGGQTRENWRTRLPQERDIPTITYLRIMRRATAADPDVDAAICLIEAFGQVGALPVAIAEAALAHPSALVRWTATRLMPATAAYASAHRTAASDTDARVRNRALQAAPAGAH